MPEQLRRRYWVEAGMALVSSVVLLVTVLWQDWIEIVFRVDPDQSSGSLEWLIVLVSLAITITAVALARREWRRAASIA
jgi:hypothetical protein